MTQVCVAGISLTQVITHDYEGRAVPICCSELLRTHVVWAGWYYYTTISYHRAMKCTPALPLYRRGVSVAGGKEQQDRSGTAKTTAAAPHHGSYYPCSGQSQSVSRLRTVGWCGPHSMELPDFPGQPIPSPALFSNRDQTFKLSKFR